MPQFRTEECKGFFEHWRSLPAAGLAPTSETFLDYAHPKYAPLVYVLEHAGTDLVIRLMGTGLVERWGKDRTGETFAVNEDPDIRKIFFENSLKIVDIPCAMRAVNRFVLSSGRMVFNEAILAPLATPHGKPTRLVSFSHVFKDPPKEEDSVGGWKNVLDHEWIDLGAGVPD